MTRGPRSIGPCFYPAGPRSRFPLPLRVALAILPPSARDAGDYTDNATSPITLHPFHSHGQIPTKSLWAFAGRMAGEFVDLGDDLGSAVALANRRVSPTPSWPTGAAANCHRLILLARCPSCFGSCSAPTRTLDHQRNPGAAGDQAGINGVIDHEREPRGRLGHRTPPCLVCTQEVKASKADASGATRLGRGS